MGRAQEEEDRVAKNFSNRGNGPCKHGDRSTRRPREFVTMPHCCNGSIFSQSACLTARRFFIFYGIGGAASGLPVRYAPPWSLRPLAMARVAHKRVATSPGYPQSGVALCGLLCCNGSVLWISTPLEPFSACCNGSRWEGDCCNGSGLLL